jgi:hypothetical protein
MMIAMIIALVIWIETQGMTVFIYIPCILCLGLDIIENRGLRL